MCTRETDRESDAWSTAVDHPAYGPLAILHDLPAAGPIFRSRPGFVAWLLDGKPEVRPAVGPSFMLGYRPTESPPLRW